MASGSRRFERDANGWLWPSNIHVLAFEKLQKEDERLVTTTGNAHRGVKGGMIGHAGRCCQDGPEHGIVCLQVFRITQGRTPMPKKKSSRRNVESGID
jgi:hypothetical protein